MSDIEKQVLRAINTYKSAVLAKNVETLMHVYDSEVRVFDAWGKWSYEGADTWRVAIEGWFSSLGGETVRVTFDDVKIVSGQGLALCERDRHVFFNFSPGTGAPGNAKSNQLGTRDERSCTSRHS